MTTPWNVEEDGAFSVEDMIPCTGLYFINGESRWEIWYVVTGEKVTKSCVGYSMLSEGLTAAQDLYNQFIYIAHQGISGVHQMASKPDIH